PSLPMSTSTTEIANAVMICKKGHVCCPMATSRPFVVCSLNTKRYAPSRRQRLASRNGSLPSVAPRTEPRPRIGCSACSRNHQLFVCSLSMERYAPSKRIRNQTTPVTDPDGMSPSGSPPSPPDLSSLPSQSRRVV
ncbi:hypothetical protein EV363DRAFT_1077176, partial [Boletus edulis]